MPISSLQLQEKDLSHAEKQRVWSRSCGQWSPRFVTQLQMQVCSNQHLSRVEIVLLATVGWKWSCQPCSCRVWQNETHCRKEICWTCLFQESIPAIPFRNSKHPLPGRSNFLTAAARSTLFALGLQENPPSSFLYKMVGVV